MMHPDHNCAPDLCGSCERAAQAERDHDYEADPFGTRADLAADRYERNLP